MISKLQKKGLSVILVISIIGMGSGLYIPSAYAETNTTPAQVDQVSNTLSNLEIDGIKMDQTFSAEVYKYSATVENEIQSITLHVKSSNQDSHITINGQSVTNGIASTYSLQTGENTFLIKVSDGSNLENTYTLTITKKQNDNNLLQSIKLSKGELSPDFSSAHTEYNVEVAKDLSAITVSPTAFEKAATIKVNDTLVTKEGVSVKLPVGKSDILIVVTAESGKKRTYTLHLTRAATTDSQVSSPSQNNRNNSFQSSLQQQNSGSVQKVSKATLSSLTVSAGEWDSTFSTSEFTYHLAVSSDTKEITINPTASHRSATILIEGSSSKTIQLDDDNKTIISVVVTYSKDDRKTYVLVFDKV